MHAFSFCDTAVVEHAQRLRCLLDMELLTDCSGAAGGLAGGDLRGDRKP